ncbi:Hypothetical protein I595_1278 [Croceitalea dokdonensis DOKDO 023]|uniref:Uncharacterized protein n=1 Tax=Croceitalea dokdonensis DOKDO 023 TaxID=1300341 RepID=A0A0P7AXF6_9FLAO|nr:hypothetical protein [Croceitalea dokdonensis]KPM32851.1 Hypothetical protein I595_1278 [Croceitalea dokdonensis DOKDO 023]
MNDIVKTSIYGIATITMLLVGAHVVSESEETALEKSLNIKKQISVNDNIVDTDKKDITKQKNRS